MYHIALKMLLKAQAKYVVLLSVLSFATMLITQQAAIFCGVMQWTASIIQNCRAPIWILAPEVQQVNEPRNMSMVDVSRVRSVPGVEWAVPLFSGNGQASLSNGFKRMVQVIGVDDQSLIGIPYYNMVEGDVADLLGPDAVLMDTFGINEFSTMEPLSVGSSFSINDANAKIVGICRAERSFFGNPYVFTTFSEIVHFFPSTERQVTYILASPLPGHSASDVAKEISRITGLQAHTEDQLFWQTIEWFAKNTGIPAAFGVTILLGFVVGMAISGQTYYAFISENAPNFAVLKAMGASKSTLRKMILIQSSLVGSIGFGVGVGLTGLFGYAVKDHGLPPFYFGSELFFFAAICMFLICALSGFLGIRCVEKLEPAMVFRG